jgi:amino acid transporter
MNQQHGLHRAIKKWELVLLFINSVIGAGIFGLPSKIFALSGIYSLLAFVVCAAIMLVFILCFAEVRSQFDQTGGPYVYTLTAFGSLPAFLMGWLLILSRIFNYATLINLLVVYVAFFAPVFNEAFARAMLIVLLTLLLSIINYVGVKKATWTSSILTIAKLFPLTVFIVIGLIHIQPGLIGSEQPLQISSFTTSVMLLIFAFGGFESMLVNSGEIDRPQKTLPFALIVSCVVIAVYYCLIQLVSIGTLPTLTTSERPLAEASQKFMGAWGGSFMVVGALISITGTLNVLLMSGSRLPFALSVERQLPQVLSYVHPKFRTPTISLVVVSILIMIVSLAWSFITALAIGSIIRILVYLFICAALIKLRKKNAEQGNHFKLKYGYLFAIIGILVSFWLLSSAKSKELIVVVISVLVGLIVFWFARKKYK